MVVAGLGGAERRNARITSHRRVHALRRDQGSGAQHDDVETDPKAWSTRGCFRSEPSEPAAVWLSKPAP